MKRDWLNLLSNVAIIIGLLALIYELNQNRQLVRAEVLHAQYGDILAHQFALMGDNAAEAIALAKTRPEKLSDQQRLVVDAHLMAVFVRLDSSKFVADRTGVFDRDLALEGVPRALKTHFNYEYAREWWGRERKMPRPWAEELVELFDKELGYTD